MNKPQRVVVLVAVLVVAAMLLFPPWQYVELRQGDNLERSAGYALVFSPPSLKNHAAIMDAYSVPKTRVDRFTNANNANVSISNMAGRPAYTPTPEPPRVVPNDVDESDYQVRLDTARLMIQCVVVIVLTIGACVALSRKGGD
jgi:hypothetical protein